VMPWPRVRSRTCDVKGRALAILVTARTHAKAHDVVSNQRRKTICTQNLL
jgi:hypothetical protein